MKDILAKKINNLKHNKKNKSQLKEIKKIILSNNPNLQITKDSNTVLFFFNQLSDKTYSFLDDFLNIHNSANSDSDIYFNIDEDRLEMPATTSEYSDSKEKYTNNEKNLLRQLKYKELIQKEQNSCDLDINEIPKKREDIFLNFN